MTPPDPRDALIRHLAELVAKRAEPEYGAWLLLAIGCALMLLSIVLFCLAWP